MSNYEHGDTLRSSIPPTHNLIKNKPPTIPIEKEIKDENEFILFELPKGFDRNLLRQIRLKKLGGNGKIIRISNEYKGICHDRTHPIPRQTITTSLKKDKSSFYFKSFDRYVKIFEDIDLPTAASDNVVPRRITFKKSMSRRKKKIATSICESK